MAESVFLDIKNCKQRAFLTAFRECGNVRAACEAAGIARSSHYRWLNSDQAYQDAFEIATDDAVDLLEAEARRRAIEGWDEPVGWYKGEAGGVVRRYDSTLLIFLLKGMRPERYADRVELKTALSRIDLTQLPDHLLERIANGEHPLAVLASAQPDRPTLSSVDNNST